MNKKDFEENKMGLFTEKEVLNIVEESDNATAGKIGQTVGKVIIGIGVAEGLVGTAAGAFA